MAATVYSLLDRNEKRVEEIISKDINTMLPTKDPAWRDTIVTSQGVGNPGLLGRDYELYKVFMESYSGVIDGAAMTNEFGLYGDDNSTQLGYKLYSQQAVRTFPSAEESPSPLPYVLKVPIRGVHTNLSMTIAELRAEATPAFIGQVLQPKLKGFAENVAHLWCNYWYISQNTGYSLCIIGSSSTSTISVSPADFGGGTIYTMTFSPTNFCVHRFFTGQRVDVFAGVATTDKRKNDTASTVATQTVSTRIAVYVIAVDEVNNKVTLGTRTDPATWGSGSGAWADGDYVLPANQRVLGSGGTFAGIAGINSWMKFGTSSSNPNDNQLLGAEAVGTADNGIVDVTRHPQLKSFLKAINGYLTEHTLRKVIRGFNSAKARYGGYLDCLIASDGVWMGYESQKIGMQWLDRTNRLASLNDEGMEEGFTFTLDGRTVKGYTSHYIDSGICYGLKKGGGNWKRYVPPDPQGASKNADIASFIPFKFVAPILTGAGSNRLPVYRTTVSSNVGNSQVTEMAQMPGYCYMQLVPDWPCMLKMTGITEDRVFGDTSFS